MSPVLHLAYTIPNPPLPELEMLGRVALAAVLAAVIGFERERRERAAGLRTHMLVSIGAATFTIISAYGFPDYFEQLEIPEGVAAPPRDPGRIAAQIVSGIGFLGGGVILRSGLNVKGLTTAASIWAMGAVGMAAGAGLYALSIMCTAALLFSLVFLRRVNALMYDRYHRDTIRLSVRFTTEEMLKTIMKYIDSQAIEIGAIAIESAGIDTEDELATIDVTLKPGTTKLDITQAVARMRGVNEVHVRDADDH
jgi:putative Mg2+ transporter-C (MgtC) family protein